ncbi:MAG: DUF5060 domain-containing protein [Eubacteriales bacterium]|nr:DUF5060 domain-containing protein [Eubacteriales bacterium]
MLIVLTVFGLSASCAADKPKIIESPETTETVFTEGTDDEPLNPSESSFEGVEEINETVWTVFGNGTALISDKSYSGGASFAVTGRENEWTGPALDLFPYIKANGAGLYSINLRLAFEGDFEQGQIINFGTLIRSDGAADLNSFISENASNYYLRLGNVSVAAESGKWFSVENLIEVKEEDLTGTHSWKLCLDMLTVDVNTVYVDDCVLKKEFYNMNTQQQIPDRIQAWIASELTLVSQNDYENPFADVTVDAVFTKGDTELTVPAFWDGGSVWRVRFMLPEVGTWHFYTVSNAESDTSLHGIEGNIECIPYEGDLEIYRRGFLKTEDGVRYFMYGDGSPFFYIGDTHWNMPAEEFDTAGEHAGDIQTDSHFKYIVDARVRQGFTVYQSEPIGAAYNLSDGLSEADIYGFRRLDDKFAYIAVAGLVHANASLFFTSELANFPDKYPDAYLEQLTRYWVARYCAYPVLWTLAQECDDDFYFDRGDQKTFNAETNPWKKVCAYIHKYDPYQSPLTAHQEYSSIDTIHGINASRSAFRDLPGHKWYAAQWSPSLNAQLDFNLPRDFYINGQDKPVVNYEGRYDYLWTKHFGARVQGWTAFLNGMCGYGYGAIDIWLYKSTYNIDVPSDDGIDIITPEDKATLWSESVNFETAYQMGYMRDFFESHLWHKLEPRFDDKSWIAPAKDALYSLASDGNNMYVCYFYNRSRGTAVINGLQDTEYALSWFNPRDNIYTDTVTVMPENYRYDLGDKPDKEDWIAVLEIIKPAD